MTIGEKIKYCRQKRGLTQKQLADASAIHPVSIRKYETDRMEPQPEQLYRIAKALNISYAALSNIRMTGLRMHTVGDLNGILMALVEARFLLYQNGELRFNPILEPYLKLENEKSYAIPISDLRVVPKIPSLVRGDYDIISFDGEPDAREKLELDQQLLENELEVNKKGGSNMTIGNKIRVLRRFRGMTQKELGIAIGLPNNGADNRITQYENNYRIPKKEVLSEIARALQVNPELFQMESSGSLQDFIYALLWLEEERPGSIRLFQVEQHADNCQSSFSGNPIGIYFNSPTMNEFLNEWLVRKQELAEGKISKDDYLEWKFSR